MSIQEQSYGQTRQHLPNAAGRSDTQDLEWWQRLAAWQTRRIELGGSKLKIAASHADFHHGNLRVQGSTIHAFDKKGGTWMPMLCDCVTFLLHVQDHQPQVGAATYMGVAAGSARPFLSALDLSNVEKQQLLPVFMARRLDNALVKRLPRLLRQPGRRSWPDQG